MADAKPPDESLPFTCTHRVDEAERATVPFTAAATAVEALANEESIARG